LREFRDQSAATFFLLQFCTKFRKIEEKETCDIARSRTRYFSRYVPLMRFAETEAQSYICSVLFFQKASQSEEFLSRLTLMTSAPVNVTNCRYHIKRDIKNIFRLYVAVKCNFVCHEYPLWIHHWIVFQICRNLY